ncbi:MAG: cysteine synthase A [Candidatus Micrarchaeia archaeon]
MVDILHNIGNTPLVKLERFSNSSNIYAKLEYLNPSGSLKDRIAHEMVHKAEERGELKKGMKIIEATSGNTGISFAMVSAALGYEFIAIMPENVTKERRQMIEAFGGRVTLTPAKEEMFGPVKKLEEMKIKYKGKAWFPSQFENPDNFKAHHKTGKEIIEQMKKRKQKIDAFVMGVGTGGTIVGVATVLRKKFKDAKIIAVEPEECAALSGGKIGHHDIQGIGEGFVPKIFDYDLMDEIITIRNKDAIKYTRELTRTEGLFCGISSGANLAACIELQKRKDMKGKNIVTILCDRGERYLSMDIWKK